MPDLVSRVHAREILDSRGNPTVEVEVRTASGSLGRASVPSGASTGRHEAVELRDGDPARFGGKGVLAAVSNVTAVIAPALAGRDPADQASVDRLLCELDGTPNKSRLGANATLGVSLACARAAAAARGVPLWRHLDADGRATLPLPMVNLISGGLHAGGHLDLQDFLLVPVSAKSFSEALAVAATVYRRLGALLGAMNFEGVLVGDEGGYGPRLPANRWAAEVIVKAIEEAGSKPGVDAAIAIDAAATHIYKDGLYVLTERKQKPRDAEGMVNLFHGWAQDYPIVSVEDPVAEDDWDGWKRATATLGGRMQLIGDDLFATNPDRLRRGVAERVANAVLVKANQIGTLTETLEVVRIAREAGYRVVISARSGETEDDWLADLAVATGAGQIKIGSVARSERLAKYNQLLRIEEEMGGPGGAPFSPWVPVNRG